MTVAMNEIRALFRSTLVRVFLIAYVALLLASLAVPGSGTASHDPVSSQSGVWWLVQCLATVLFVVEECSAIPVG